MSKTLVKAAVLGGLIVFIWGMFSWMVFPWHQSCLNKFTNESEVASAIMDNAPTSGVYVLPNTFAYNEKTCPKQMSEGMNMMENGPFMFASVMPNGIGKMSMKPFILSLILQMIGAFIVSWMLMKTRGLDFMQQVGFVTLFGLSIGLLGKLPDWTWWGFSGCYIFISILDLAISWFLAGLAIAKVLHKRA